MNKGILTGITATAFAASLALAAPASAAVTFDPATGTGFVGKGDVQLALGWNNKQLQDNAAGASFEAVSETVTEVTWVCTNTRNENTQERERTTTTTRAGVVSAVTRDGKKQITGFTLTGYDGPVAEESSTEGPQLNSCPASSVLTTPAGDPEVLSSSEALTVSHGSTSGALA